MEALRISGKDLGYLALPNFCPRCFWVQRRAPEGLPFQIFTGIFSSIDAYTKRVVHQHFRSDLYGLCGLSMSNDMGQPSDFSL